MNRPTLSCQNEQRRHAVRASDLNGLDYLEVEVNGNEIFLCVHFLKTVPDIAEPIDWQAEQIEIVIGQLDVRNIRIEGGQRIRNIQVVPPLQVHRSDDPTLDGCLRIRVDKLGDFSTYKLRLVEEDLDGNLRPLSGFDPRYAQLDFTFRAGCPTDLDCRSQPVCPTEIRSQPEINYLAKDYSSFRQLILDRLALTLPDWHERHVPDLGITLVELLAYVGDYLSYYQDAVATEAYLETARQRISVRRHVRLVDYPMHEGCNARTWVWLQTSSDLTLDSTDFYFVTRYDNAPVDGTILTNEDLTSDRATKYEVFEPMLATSQIQIYRSHNKIHFYTWGDRQCCLPKGATTATLWAKSHPPESEAQQRLHLQVGEVLIFEEVKGANGNSVDADRNHRHAVRLVRVEYGEDPLYQQSIVEVEWAVEDALPFPLCISTIGGADCRLIEDISVARGNVLLVDHGRTVLSGNAKHISNPSYLGCVQGIAAPNQCEGEGEPRAIAAVPARFYPRLKQAPLTFRQPLGQQELTTAPAATLLRQDPRQAQPQLLSVIGIPDGAAEIDQQQPPTDLSWAAQSDLLASRESDRHFAVEIDNEGYAHLRFGEPARHPDAQTCFFASYRIGNGAIGNIGAETIAYLVLRQTRLSGVSIQPYNPLPAQGGTAPEPLAEVKLYAPFAFRQQRQRAVTPQDYADLVLRDFPDRVQRAAAILRWTGSWTEVLVAIDPLGSTTASPALLEKITRHLYRYRRIGHDLVVRSAVSVPLDVALTVCVQASYLRGQVKAALLEAFSNRVLLDGRRGFFHPDNLTFGSGIYLSQLVAVAQAVTGVQSATVTRLQRLHETAAGELESGLLSLSPLEIPRLDGDRNFPENGKLELIMQGGRG